MKSVFTVAVISILCLQLSAQDQSKPYQPDLKGDLMLDYGFSFWDIKMQQLPVKVWGSNTVSTYYNRRFEINNRLSFHPAVGFSFEKYAFKDDYTWINEAGVVSLDTISGVSLDKNKLTVSYFEIPLEFRIHPLGTVNGEGWFIGLGGVAGVRMGAHTKIKYDANGDTFKEKVYDDFGLRGYRYGLVFRFGFRNVHFYYKTYLSDLFKESPDGGERIPRASTIGINVSGF